VVTVPASASEYYDGWHTTDGVYDGINLHFLRFLHANPYCQGALASGVERRGTTREAAQRLAARARVGLRARA